LPELASSVKKYVTPALAGADSISLMASTNVGADCIYWQLIEKSFLSE
jgi:hypothetical protein